MSDPREDSRAGSLAGLLVVSIEQAVAAPLCTVRLADAGARVIKIERPEGETARHYDSSVAGMSAYFVWLNRGKESAALDLKAKEDMALLHRLVAKADIFVQNLAPGAIDRLGLSRATLGESFPRLISVHIVGYGQDTPYADMRAYDMLVQAESGVCAVTGSPETPSKVGVSVADIATGMNAHAAVLERCSSENVRIAVRRSRSQCSTAWRIGWPFRFSISNTPSARPAGSVWRMRPSIPIGLTRAATVGPSLSQFSSRANGVGSAPRSCGGTSFSPTRGSRPTPRESPTDAPSTPRSSPYLPPWIARKQYAG